MLKSSWQFDFELTCEIDTDCHWKWVQKGICICIYLQFYLKNHFLLWIAEWCSRDQRIWSNTQRFKKKWNQFRQRSKSKVKMLFMFWFAFLLSHINCTFTFEKIYSFHQIFQINCQIKICRHFFDAKFLRKILERKICLKILVSFW